MGVHEITCPACAKRYRIKARTRKKRGYFLCKKCGEKVRLSAIPASKPVAKKPVDVSPRCRSTQRSVRNTENVTERTRTRPGKRRRFPAFKVVAAILVVSASAAAAVYFVNLNFRNANGDSSPDGVRTVEAASIVRRSFQIRTPVEVTFEPLRETILSVPADFRIENVFCKTGDMVARGDKITTIRFEENVSEKIMQLKEKDLKLSGLIASLKLDAQRSLDAAERMKRLTRERTLVRKEQKKLRELTDYRVIRSPHRGVVSELYTEKGCPLKAGRPVARIVQPDRLFFPCPVERKYSDDPTLFLKTKTRTYRVQPGKNQHQEPGMILENPDHFFSPGKTYPLEWIDVREYPSVPQECIVHRGERPRVFIIRANKIVEQNALSLSQGGYTALEGPVPGSDDKAVYFPPADLKEGESVTWSNLHD